MERTDTGIVIDTGNATDTGSTMDTGNATDTGSTMDTGNATDTGNTMNIGNVIDTENAMNTVNTEQIQCIDKDHPEYPQKMRQYPSMPSRIYLKGRLPSPDKPTVAVIGARMCSPYGRIQAFRYAKALSEAGVQIISGMALGIDSEGHKGALEGKMPTFAVLGCGVDVCYPKTNKQLYKRILWENGGIISECPPGTQPMPWCFPARNRIISGLAEWILVIEAKEKSGSLITADMALEQGRDIYALPGMVTEPLSCGCNRLIRQGAGILLNEEDLLEELVIKGLLKKKIAIISDTKNKIKLETKENLVYSKLGLYPRGLDDLQRETGLTPQEVMGICVSLQLKGCIQERSKNYYVRAK